MIPLIVPLARILPVTSSVAPGVKELMPTLPVATTKDACGAHVPIPSLVDMSATPLGKVVPTPKLPLIMTLFDGPAVPAKATLPNEACPCTAKVVEGTVVPTPKLPEK